MQADAAQRSRSRPKPGGILKGALQGVKQSQCSFVLATGREPGAIAIVQLIGATEGILRTLTGVSDWPIGRMRLVDLDGIDEGLAGRLGEDVAELMPHGGPRVVQRLIGRLLELGVEAAGPDDVDPRELYPEAADRYEALALGAVARARSPLAIDLLLDQPRRWRKRPRPTPDVLARSQRLDRLIEPPLVVLAGPPNVGKSTLSNALLGRSMSIALDRPGTTRDYTSGRIELAGLVVDWHDTPGISPATSQPAADPIEAKAVDLARRLIGRADFLVAMTDHEHDWPALARQPHLWVMNKTDLAASGSKPSSPGLSSPGALTPTALTPALTSPRRVASGDRREREWMAISAMNGDGVPEMVTMIRDRLVPPADLADPGPWVFDSRLMRR